jgi:hypothetical protein
MFGVPNSVTFWIDLTESRFSRLCLTDRRLESMGLRPTLNFRAQPVQKKRACGKAKPFRTSGGTAASTLPQRVRRFHISLAPWLQPGGLRVCAEAETVQNGSHIVDASSTCSADVFSLPSPSGRGLGEGLTDEPFSSFSLGEMISLPERNHLSQTFMFLESTILSPHPQPFSQREKGDPNTTA